MSGSDATTSLEVGVEAPASIEPAKLPRESPQHSRRLDLDGLRGLAISAVVIYSIKRTLMPGGFTGVDIFFVISGYVLTANASRHSEEGICDFVLGFYSRRVVRLYPAFLLVLWYSATMAAILFPPFMHDRRNQDRLAMTSLFGSANVYLSRQEKGDLKSQWPAWDPLKHTWSLSVEEQFYVIFPLVLCFSMRSGKAIPRAVMWAGMASKSLLVCCIYTMHYPRFAYYSFFSRVWEIAAGALLAETQDKWGSIVDDKFGVRVACQVGALLCFAMAFTFATEGSGTPLPWAPVSVVGAVCFISAGVSPASSLNSIFSHPIPVYVGDLSYVLYLWHWPIIVLWQLLSQSTETWGSVGLLLLTLGVVSIVTHHLLEKPFLRARHRWSKWQVFIGLALASTLSAVYLSLLRVEFYGSFSIRNALEPASFVDITKESASRHNQIAEATIDAPPLPDAQSLPASILPRRADTASLAPHFEEATVAVSADGAAHARTPRRISFIESKSDDDTSLDQSKMRLGYRQQGLRVAGEEARKESLSSSPDKDS